MTTVNTATKRDLQADLALCESVRGVYYDEGGGYRADYPDGYSRHYFEEADEGWPEALRRAIAAEAGVERLREALTTVMQVSKWDGISHELDRCYSTARDALEEVTADASR